MLELCCPSANLLWLPVPQFPPLQHGLTNNALCQERLKRVAFNASNCIGLVEHRGLEMAFCERDKCSESPCYGRKCKVRSWRSPGGSSASCLWLSQKQEGSATLTRSARCTPSSVWKHGRMSQGTWDLLGCEFALWFLPKSWLTSGHCLYIYNTVYTSVTWTLALDKSFSEFYCIWFKDGTGLKHGESMSIDQRNQWLFLLKKLIYRVT